MKITKRQLRRIIRENMALRMTQDRMRGRSGSYSEPRANKAAQKRKGNEPITRNNVVKGSFEGTSSDRMKLVRELEPQIEKMIAAGKEDQIPSNWRDVLSLADGDQLLALKQAVNPGIFKKMGRFFGMTESKKVKITNRQLRRIIRESLRDIQAERSTVVRERAKQLFSEGLTPAQVRTQLIEEGFGDFLRKGVDKLKQKTGLGMSSKTAEVKEKLRGTYSVFLEWCDDWFPTAAEFKAMIKAQQEYGKETKGADYSRVYQAALDRLPKKKQETLKNPNILRKKIIEMDNFIDDAVEDLPRASQDKTADKVRKFHMALTKELEAKMDLVKNMQKAFKEAMKTGQAEGIQELINIANISAENARKAAGIALTKQENEERKERMNRKSDPKKNPADDGEKMLSKSRHSENR